MRLIDADAFKEKFTGQYEFMKRIIDEEPMATEWVSVGNGLPKVFELCIIYIKVCEGVSQVADCMAVYNGFEWQWWVDGLADEVEATVTHWMPLPKQPKEDA